MVIKIYKEHGTAGIHSTLFKPVLQNNMSYITESTLDQLLMYLFQCPCTSRTAMLQTATETATPVQDSPLT